MSEDEINRAIAEHLGWKWHDHPDTLEKTEGWTLPNSVALNPDGEIVSPRSAPNFCGDLNAMHEAEKTVNDKRLYIAHLVETLKSGEYAVLATSHQRAEAFLRTVGKWKENK